MYKALIIAAIAALTAVPALAVDTPVEAGAVYRIDATVIRDSTRGPLPDTDRVEIYHGRSATWLTFCVGDPEGDCASGEAFTAGTARVGGAQLADGSPVLVLVRGDTPAGTRGFISSTLFADGAVVRADGGGVEQRATQLIVVGDEEPQPTPTLDPGSALGIELERVR